MSNYRKNLMVGVTVTSALVLLGVMIVRFGDAPVRWFTKPQIAVRILAERADGLGEGSPVYYRGVSVGRVQNVRLDGNQGGVVINALLDHEPAVPANVRARITSALIGGSSSITLELPPDQPEAVGKLQANARIEARFMGSNAFPREFTDLADSMRSLTDQFRQSHLVEHVDEVVVSSRQQLDRMGKLMDSVQDVVGDQKVHDDIRESIASFRRSSDNLERVTLSANTLVADASKTLERMESISRKLDEGKGAAGLLINDPRLYESMVDTSRTLNLTIHDMQRLVEQWEQEGVHLKLK